MLDHDVAMGLQEKQLDGTPLATTLNKAIKLYLDMIDIDKEYIVWLQSKKNKEEFQEAFDLEL